jgi:Mitochondrial 39-S ribosomal protein L47 (MRP-L47)
MLLTEQQLSRRKGIPFPQPQRLVKVRKGMGAIKQVLGERKREHLQRLKVDNNISALYKQSSSVQGLEPL